MCLCNIDSPSEYLNMIENEDQRDPIKEAIALEFAQMTDAEKAEAEERLRLAAVDAMFDELVEALSAVVSAIDPELTGKLGRVMLEPYFERPVSVARSLLSRARLLQRSGK
jgi:hypothetical protein